MRQRHMRAPEGEVRIDPSNGHTFKTPRIGRITEQGQFEVVWEAVKPEAPVPFPSTRPREAWEKFLAELYSSWGNQWSAPAK
jgi:urea transport system substrate-binding protein